MGRRRTRFMDAKYTSQCPTCRQEIVPGDRVEWRPGWSARHLVCPQKLTLLPPAPPPVQFLDGAAVQGDGVECDLCDRSINFVSGFYKDLGMVNPLIHGAQSRYVHPDCWM